MNYILFFLYWFWIIMILFMFLKHPLLMSVMLIINTFFLCIFISVYSFSSWNSYILFLMFLGGILILFLYNISLISTEIFSFMLKKKDVMKMVFIYLILSSFFFMKQSFHNDMMNIFYMKNIYSMMTFFLSENKNSITFFIIYLFLTLICVVNLIYLMKDKGAIRKM
uniref:NADH dehydrogenase subunit 6 n=1 Tax=Psephenothrips eriobotryae TaxID=2913602 RepID=A0A9E6YHV4_9NEOP|nr:NADH dehydrogenase subunit 6 [Psephenothrips eriobotryae]UJY97339.1 NADH dehydrogenase subunit 6 [Psephenothrips eriobotryae]